MAVANSRKGGKSQNVKTRQSISKKSDEVGRGDIIRPKRKRNTRCKRNSKA